MSTAGSFSTIGTPRAVPINIVDHILIIRALILRNLRLKYLDRPAGFFLEFLRPTVIDVSHYYIFSAMGRSMPAGIKVEEWVWAGFTVWLTFTGVWGPIKGTRGAPTVPFPGVSAMHVRLAACIWPVIINTVFLYGSVAIMILFGDHIPFPNVLITAFTLSTAAFMGLGFGLLIGGISRAVPLLDPFLHLLPWFLLMGSGIYASLSNMPRFMQVIIVWSPTIHLTEFERYAFDSGYPITLVQPWYPLLWAFLLIVPGLAMAKRFR